MAERKGELTHRECTPATPKTIRSLDKTFVIKWRLHSRPGWEVTRSERSAVGSIHTESKHDRELREDPRDLIMGPYVLCPKCGLEQFSVLSIRDMRCTRRCRNCWHKADYNLPDIRKKIVYIDQFAVSNIMKVLSPNAKGHERAASEPHGKNFSRRWACCATFNWWCAQTRDKSLKRTYEHFSGGLSFRASEDIKRQQIARVAQCWLRKEPATFDFDAQQITHGRLHEWADRIYITVEGVLPDSLMNCEQREAMATKVCTKCSKYGSRRREVSRNSLKQKNVHTHRRW